MAKLVVSVLLCVLGLAAAVDVENLKHGHHKGKKHGEDFEYQEQHNSYLQLKHREFEWDEHIIKTFPCAPEYEILGSTVAQSNEITIDGKKVGSVYWTGIVAWHDIDHDSKDYKAADFHKVKVNYEVIFEIDGKGQIITKAVSDSIFSQETAYLAVLGGSGHFVGASGVTTWTGTGATSGKYRADIFLPKVYKEDDDYGGKYYRY